MLAANGAKVVVNGRDEAAVRETVQRASAPRAATRPGSQPTLRTSVRCNGCARKPSACTGRPTCSERSWLAEVRSPARPPRSPNRSGTPPSGQPLVTFLALKSAMHPLGRLGTPEDVAYA